MNRSSIELQATVASFASETSRNRLHYSNSTPLAASGKPPGQSQQLPDNHDPERDTPATTRPPTPTEEESGVEFGRHEFSLPPTDSGKDAWLFLAASFMMEALVWGMFFLQW